MQRSALAAENLRTIRRHKSPALSKSTFASALFAIWLERRIPLWSFAHWPKRQKSKMTPAAYTNERSLGILLLQRARWHLLRLSLTRGRLKSQIKVSDGIRRRTKERSGDGAPLLTQRKRVGASFCPMAAVHLDNCLFSSGLWLPVCVCSCNPGFKGEVTPAGHRDKAW